jgi:hypothetical protein
MALQNIAQVVKFLKIDKIHSLVFDGEPPKEVDPFRAHEDFMPG